MPRVVIGPAVPDRASLDNEIARLRGLDVKALRAIVRLRKQDVDERREQEAILETYMHALGMLN